MKLSKTPLALAIVSTFAATLPLAGTAHAQSAKGQTTQPAPATPASVATPASPNGTPDSASVGNRTSTQGKEQMLPTVNVSGAPETGTFQAKTSTVGARTPTALRDIAQQVTVINRSLLESQGAMSFQDALRNAPGVTIGAAEGGPIGNNINLRGFTARTDIYRDGFHDRGQYYRDTFDLESIEVLYGPSSMLFGRGRPAV